jgi:type II secretory ATPase GspE/PulE/Tfp pilus assembly ATPase PilB-like protein
MKKEKSKRIDLTDGALIYLRRASYNPFRFLVTEIALDEVLCVRRGKSLFGNRLTIEKTDGRTLSLPSLKDEEAASITDTIRKRRMDSQESDGAAQASARGMLLDFETRLNEVFQDETNCISKLVELVIEKAIELKASDIHLEPLERVKIRYRIDGVLIDVAEIPTKFHARIVSRIKVLAKLPTYEKDAPLDGRIEKSYGAGLDLRISTFPTIRGDNVVIRIFDSQSHLFGLDELGFDGKTLEQFESLILAPEGTILLTGPSNSGKTTTIYSALETIHEVKRNSVNIVTIEDPVERDLRKFSQTQIAPARGLTFDSALRSVLRQDPNVIMVGEIRDKETANTAIRAGMTGHLVITTIHSGTAAGAFARLMEMELEPFILASSISGIMAQRLVRKVCAKCARESEPRAELLRRFGIEGALRSEMKGAGCGECAGAGYKGRTAIAELLLMNDALRKGILERLPVLDLKKLAVENGMNDLLQNGIEKIRAGVTNLDELARVLAPNEA